MKETARQILDTAQDLVRSRGYNAYSFADISERVGIRKASIHYHFSSKEVLTRELVKRYRTTFRQKLATIDRSGTDPRAKLLDFLELYREGLNRHRMCLCGVLAAEMSVLPESVQEEVGAFFRETRAWLTDLLRAGESSGDPRSRLSPEKKASLVLATVQGAQLLARADEDSESAFDRIAGDLADIFLPA